MLNWVVMTDYLCQIADIVKIMHDVHQLEQIREAGIRHLSGMKSLIKRTDYWPVNYVKIKTD